MATGLSDDVAIVSVQFQVGGDQCEIVIPMIATGPAPADFDFCKSAVDAFDPAIIDLLKPCLSDEVSIIGIQAVGGIDGKIPYRRNFELVTNPGTATGHPEPASIGAKMSFYFDPADVSPGNRTVVSHNTIPGISEDDDNDKVLSDALVALIQAVADALVAGVTGSGPATVWKRCNKAIRVAGDATIRIAVRAAARKIVGSVKRRLVPDFRL